MRKIFIKDLKVASPLNWCRRWATAAARSRRMHRGGGMALLVGVLMPITPIGNGARLLAECSDSGFCRLPVATAESDRINTFAIGVRGSFSAGHVEDRRVLHEVVALDASWKPWSTSSVLLEVPVVRNHGDRGSATGLGDVLLAIDQRLATAPSGTWSVSAGLRLPTGDDQKLAGAPLEYQPGLGSTDLIFAVGWRRAGFDARVGYILALGTNGTEGIKLRRGDDVPLAVGYTIEQEHIAIRGGLQAVHRLSNSTAVDSTGRRYDVPDSAGTQVNLQASLTYALSAQTHLIVDGAVALLERQNNADIDGLTRSWSLAAFIQQSW